jgi:RecA-family ATPase
VERLQNRIKESRAQIEEAKKKAIKDKNIKERIETLLKGKKKGILDD